MLAKMPEQSILGEAHVPYLLFNNSHDGFGSVRVTMTNTRVVCQNTLNIAMEQAPRIWSCAHKGDMENKLHEAQATMRAVNLYMAEFEKEAERLAAKKISPEEVRKIMDVLFPVGDESLGLRKINNLIYLKAGFERALARPDIENFKNTAYGLINAASDFVIHTEPLRKTATTQENKLRSFMNGNPILDTVYKLVA
jgi:phage/plasmid-like protein (TIGR03299 family)